MEVTNSDLLKKLFYEPSCNDMIDDNIGYEHRNQIDSSCKP